MMFLPIYFYNNSGGGPNISNILLAIVYIILDIIVAAFGTFLGYEVISSFLENDKFFAGVCLVGVLMMIAVGIITIAMTVDIISECVNDHKEKQKEKIKKLENSKKQTEKQPSLIEDYVSKLNFK